MSSISEEMLKMQKCKLLQKSVQGQSRQTPRDAKRRAVHDMCHDNEDVRDTPKQYDTVPTVMVQHEDGGP